MSLLDDNAWDILTDRSDFRHSQCQPSSPASPLAHGDVRVRMDRLALSANNVSYAVYGDKLGYWQYFPAPEGYGRVPVWGYGTVVESHSEVSVGTRIFGLFPLSTSTVLQPGVIDSIGFSDLKTHREGLPSVYNRYALIQEKTPEREAKEDIRALVWPLFVTAYLLDRYLDQQEFFGADTVVLTSASSKTAMAIAWLLKHTKRPVKVVGLTSKANVGFVHDLDLFDSVLDYDSISKISKPNRTVSVDMAGNATVLSQLHKHLDFSLVYSCLIGGAHWENRKGFDRSFGPKPVVFFAPAYRDEISKTMSDADFDIALNSSMTKFISYLNDKISILFATGAEDIINAFSAVVEGSVDPSSAYILLPNGK